MENGSKYDVVIVGGGIVAATFARLLTDSGCKVAMMEIGAQHSRRPGENLKNFPLYQIDVDQFGGAVLGLGPKVCIAPANGNTDHTRNGLNPRQDPNKNLDGAVVAYALGGMAIHWTCAIPRHHPTLERIPDQILPAAEWDGLYGDAEGLLNRHIDVHEPSIRHQVLKRILSRFEVQNTPLAAERRNPEFVQYTGADTVLGPLAEPGGQRTLEIVAEHRVSQLLHDNGRVRSAVVRDIRTRAEKIVHADAFVVAAGWVHTPQILWNSWIHRHEFSALGRFVTDHTFAACQVVLKPAIVKQIAEEARSASAADPTPLGIPMKDPAPHLYIPVAEGRRWHGQIFREAFQFDPLTPTVDSRLIIDLKWFGMIDPVETNRVTFEPDIMDRFGMPQPTFDFQLGAGDRERQDSMIEAMREVAGELGDFLPGSEPRFLPLGTSTHTMGATRMGVAGDGKSVVDSHSLVHGFENLYLGGNCLIPTANASNPTLTSVALAVRAARHMIGYCASVRPDAV